MSPTEWMQSLLHARGLESPDGRPLYRYRLTDSEFAQLGQLIQFTTNFGVSNITSMLTWDAAFVMYASEWWRREFAGKWGWEQVFQSVNIDFNQLSVGSRNTLIDRGLNRWHRQVRIKEGTRRFLGTIATEGGLPLHKLSESGGWLKRVLQPTLQRHIAKGYSISALIEAHSLLIPVSLRSEEIVDVLEDVVQAIVDLREQYDLGSKDTPVKWLDESIPGWRDEFPLPLDDDAARSLLKDLVDTASRAKVEHNSGNPFELERILVRPEGAAPGLVAEIDIPSFVSVQSLGLDSEQVSLPSTVEVEVVGEGGFCKPWCRGVLTTFHNKRSYKLSGNNFKIEGDAARKNLSVSFKSMGEIVGEMNILKAESLELDVPWTFKRVDERWVLHGTASQSVRDEEAIVFCPQDYAIGPIDEVDELVRLSSFMVGFLWRLRGSATCCEGLDKYQIRTTCKDSTVSYQLQGKNFPFESNPRTVFIGKPHVFEMDVLSGFSKKSHARVLARKVGGVGDDAWRSLEFVDAGVYQVCIIDADTNILFSQTVGILPECYKHEIEPRKNEPRCGDITISGVICSQIACLADGASITHSSNDSVYRFTLNAIKHPPKSVEVSILPNGQSRLLSLVYPYPTRGAMLFDPNDQIVPAGSYLHLDRLLGYRLRIFNDKTHLSERFVLTLALLDHSIASSDLRDIYIKRRMKLYGDYIELAVSDWTHAINALLGVSRSLDACVRISLILNEETLCQFDVRRYEHAISLNFSEQFVELATDSLSAISIDMLDATQVVALPMIYPDLDPVLLNARKTQDVNVGIWDFDAETKQPGPWIVYPAPGSQLAFRPVLWNVASPTGILVADADTFPATIEEVVCIRDESERRQSLRFYLKKMADDFSHPAWSYMDSLWEKTNHLPLACFDLWQVASQTTSFLAALLVKNQLEVLEKMDKEFPIIWEIVPQREWQDTLGAYRTRLMDQLHGDEDFVSQLVEAAIRRIGHQSPSLSSMEKNLLGVVMGVHSPEMGVMAHPLSVFIQPQLSGEYQKLFQRQADSDWPVLLGSNLKKIYESLPEQYQQIVIASNQYQQSVVYLPFVLAWHAIFGDQDELFSGPAEVFKVQQLKNFDEDWFDVSFKFLSGWLSQQESV